jgi:hypothetical protein
MLALVALAAFATSTAFAAPADPSCSIIWDGRVPLSETGADFDQPSSKYDHQYVHGDSTSGLPLHDTMSEDAHVSENTHLYCRPNLGGDSEVSRCNTLDV